MTRIKCSGNQSGFTIIELLIATAVLSVILILTTAVITGIGNLYYKGINQSRIQSTVRNVTDEVSQQLQLTSSHLTSGDNLSGTYHSYCIGTTRYSYVINNQIGTNGFAHVLWRDALPSTGCTPADLTDPTLSGGTELMAPNSRLTDFNINVITSNPYVYDVSVAAAYGADDVLNWAGKNTTCTGGSDGSFCSTARLSTTAMQRVTK